MSTPREVAPFCDTPSGISSSIIFIGRTTKSDAAVSDWECDEWNVTLYRGAAKMRTVFYTGVKCGIPTTADVVASLVADAWFVEDGPDEYAAEIYSVPKWTEANKRFLPTLTETWNGLVRQTEEFREFVGDLATTLGMPMA